MSKYIELGVAIDKILQNVNETDEFKRGLERLIENFMENSYHDDDIREILKLTSLKEV